MSWTKKNVHPGKIVSTSQEVEVMVLEIDSAKRRVSLGLKQTQRNPWEVFAENNPVGTEIEGEVKNITEFGLFVGLDNDIDGMVHLSDITWEGRGEDALGEFHKNDMVKAIVTEVDVEKERISLSIKAMDGSFDTAVDGVKRGSIITVEVTSITPRPASWACPSRHARSQKRKKLWSSTAPPTAARPWAISLVRL